jgi:malate dehydrogenase (oxaloacetate-decarboxylating)(NADP+)
VTDEMLFAVACGLVEQVTQAQLDSCLLYPPQTNILETEIKNAVRVCEVIFEHNLAQVAKPKNIRSWLNSQLYKSNC